MGEARKKAEAAKREAAKKKAEAEGKEPPAEEAAEISEEEPEEVEEPEVEEPEVNETPPTVELDEDEKKLLFIKSSTPDLTPYHLNTSFGKFSVPKKAEGF